jgi:5-hydroxyisourate hydrolase-like protein (transthyretin family)
MVGNGGKVTVTVTVRNASTNAPAANEPVQVTAPNVAGGTYTCNAVTNTSGTAACVLTTKQPLRSGASYQISVAATTDYLAGSGSGQITTGKAK